MKKQRHHFANKGPYGQSYGFSSSRVWMWELDYKKVERQTTDAFKMWFWRRFLKSPLDSKEIKPVNPKGTQSWIFTGRTDDEALIFWPPDVKRELTGKDPDVGKDWRQKRTTEDEMVGCHHWLNGHEFQQAPGNVEGLGSLVCCSPWGRRVRHHLATEFFDNCPGNLEDPTSLKLKRVTVLVKDHFFLIPYFQHYNSTMNLICFSIQTVIYIIFQSESLNL